MHAAAGNRIMHQPLTTVHCTNHLANGLLIHPADLQAMTDDMLVKLAPKFGVQLPPELQQRVEQEQQQQQKQQQLESSSSSRSRGRAAVVFPGDFKMAPVESV